MKKVLKNVRIFGQNERVIVTDHFPIDAHRAGATKPRSLRSFGKAKFSPQPASKIRWFSLELRVERLVSIRIRVFSIKPSIWLREACS